MMATTVEVEIFGLIGDAEAADANDAPDLVAAVENRVSRQNKRFVQNSAPELVRHDQDIERIS